MQDSERKELRRLGITPNNPYGKEEMYIYTLIKKFPESIKTCNEELIRTFFTNILQDSETEHYLNVQANSFSSMFSKPLAKFFESQPYFTISNNERLLAELIVRDFVKYSKIDTPLKEKKFRAKLIFMFCLEALMFNKKEHKEILADAVKIDPLEFKKQLELAIITMASHAQVYENEGNIKGKEINLYGVKELKELYKSIYKKEFETKTNYG